MRSHIDDNLSASLEDYLEAIYHLSQGPEGARSKDIAQKLAVSRASVTGALRTLAERGLVNYRPYGQITLTEQGRSLAAHVARRHEVLNRFFAEVLGADADLAHRAACRAEHALGPEITPRLTAFVDYVMQSQDDEIPIAGQFQRYWENFTHGG
ncbi:MAG: metal-dependent transcriptional regulator [Planctomycetota bacterium]